MNFSIKSYKLNPVFHLSNNYFPLYGSQFSIEVKENVESCFQWNLWKQIERKFSIIIVEFSLLRVDEFTLLYCLILTKYCKECKESTYLRKSIYISECWVAPIRPQECSTSIAVILLADPHYWWLSIMRTWKW